IFQGLLCVFYNLGDGGYNLTLPSYRLDNGEWHEVFLDRHDNEITLRLDGGGGKREVKGSQGRSRQIIIDSTAVMLGNSFPFDINKSFQEAGLIKAFFPHGLEKKAGTASHAFLRVSPGSESYPAASGPLKESNVPVLRFYRAS
ncbi:hypothetical protein GOODEAATRI_029490, partial [Goodea atripinnis]